MIVWTPPLDDNASGWQRIATTLTQRYFADAAASIDAEQRYPQEHLPRLLESGVTGMFIPRRYGGSGASLTALAAVVEAVAEGCASTAAIIAALSLGAYPLLIAGSEEQKVTLLGQLARRGEAINFALSERGAGSDAAAIETTATAENGGWKIRGEKCWLGNGGSSKTFIVFAKTPGSSVRRSMTAFIVPRSNRGVTVDFYEDKMGIRGTTTTNLKLDTWVPDKNRVGEVGGGLKLALETLNEGRVVIAAQAIGIGLCAFKAACDFAVHRRAFNQLIIDHEGVGFKLADSAVYLSVGRMALYEAARTHSDAGTTATLGAMAKLFASEAAHRVVNNALQVLGGRGYVKGNVVERCYRDQRITEIYEGTSEVQRMILMRAIKSECIK